jgi:hypothetical protein
MKKLLLLVPVLLFATLLKAQTLSTPKAAPGKPITWKESQLIQPAELAATMANAKAKKPLLYNIGVVDDIPEAKNFGGASEAANLEKFKTQLQTLPKSTYLVVYCGCCPFERCPNVRPAMTLLNEMGFSNAHLLNLPTNLKTDWIAKGYPVVKK